MDFGLESIMSGFDLLFTVIIWILVICVIGVLAFWLWQTSRYNIKVRIKDVVNDRAITLDDKARRVRDKDGIYWWKLLKAKVRIPEPSPLAIDIDNKGKKRCDFFRLEDSGYFPAKSTKGYLAITGVIDQRLFTNTEIQGSEPFTTQQRALYINELRESENYKRTSKSDLIAKAIPFIALVLILSIFMLFFQETVQPIIQVGNQYVEASEKLSETVGKLDAVVNNRQVMDDEEVLSDVPT